MRALHLKFRRFPGRLDRGVAAVSMRAVYHQRRGRRRLHQGPR